MDKEDLRKRIEAEIKSHTSYVLGEFNHPMLPRAEAIQSLRHWARCELSRAERDLRLVETLNDRYGERLDTIKKPILAAIKDAQEEVEELDRLWEQCDGEILFELIVLSRKGQEEREREWRKGQ